jgi:hypothetical protein
VISVGGTRFDLYLDEESRRRAAEIVKTLFR